MTEGVKLVVLGQSAVGKTCIANRYVKRTFTDQEATIGGLFVLQHASRVHIARATLITASPPGQGILSHHVRVQRRTSKKPSKLETTR